MIWKYISDVLCRAIAAANTGFGYLSIFTTLFTGIAKYNGIGPNEFANVYSFIFYLSLVIILWVLLIYAPYATWKEQYLITQENAGKASDLQFQPMDPYPEQLGPSKVRKVLPVVIVNQSNTQTIEAVRVNVVRAKAGDNVIEINTDLITERNGQTSIDISPNTPEVFRFGRQIPGGSSAGITLSPLIESSLKLPNKNYLPNGEYEVLLRATGKNTKPCDAIFLLNAESGKEPGFRLNEAAENECKE